MNQYKICLLVFDDGRQGLLERTLETFTSNLEAGFRCVIISDDSGCPKRKEYLENILQETTIVDHHPQKLGFCQSIARTWNLVPEDCDYVFHLENDFTLDRPVKIKDMIVPLEEEGDLCQVVLLRHPVNESEKGAGGLVKRDWSSFTQKQKGDVFWFEHRISFSTNPTIYRRKLLDIGWPVIPQCEGKFGWHLKTDLGMKFAYFGKMTDDPIVTHIGHQRTGFGY